MPTPTTALALISGAMRLFGALASGEEPTPDEAKDGLAVLNDLLEDWSLQNLAVWGSVNQSFTTSPGVSTYTIGAGGTFNVNRPIDIFGAYCTFGGVDFPIDLIDQDRYNRIDLKTQQQPIIEQLLYINEVPLGTIVLWPVPMMAVPLVLSLKEVLTNVPDIATTLVYPPGYAKALRYALAVNLAPEFGKTAPPDVLGIAKTSKGTLKVANMRTPTMGFDGVLTGEGPVTWQRGY